MRNLTNDEMLVIMYIIAIFTMGFIFCYVMIGG